MSAIKISNSKGIEAIADAIVTVMDEWDGESEATKQSILSVLNESAKAPTNISNCTFK